MKENNWKAMLFFFLNYNWHGYVKFHKYIYNTKYYTYSCVSILFWVLRFEYKLPRRLLSL